MTRVADGIQKTVLSAGEGDLPAYPPESFFAFDFVLKLSSSGEVLDDSKLHAKPVSLYSGKGFQIAFWETCLATMRVGETSSFTVEPELLSAFPVQYRKLRDYLRDRRSSHCCGMMGVKDGGGLGYADLDRLLAQPERLEFVFSLKEAKLAQQFRKEAWIMRPEEKREAVPQLREEGNDLYKAGSYELAAAKYSEALGMLEDLSGLERPQDTKWQELDAMKVPFLLNLAQCQLLLQNYYQVIDLCTQALQRQPDSVKALFRRAKAHAAVWNEEEAKADFLRVAELDPSLQRSCTASLQQLAQRIRQNEADERRMLKGKLAAA